MLALRTELIKARFIGLTVAPNIGGKIEWFEGKEPVDFPATNEVLTKAGCESGTAPTVYQDCEQKRSGAGSCQSCSASTFSQPKRITLT